MNNRLVQLQQRIHQLETLADEVVPLVGAYYKDDHSVDVALATKGQQWYRGCRTLLAQYDLSTLREFEECYENPSDDSRDAYYNLEPVLCAKSRNNIGMTLPQFMQGLRKARSLMLASEQEILSRDLLQLTQLSFFVVVNEFETAQRLLDEAPKEEVFIRAAGVIGRVALERHLWTMVDSRSMTIPKNPASKKLADVSDVLAEFVKKNIVTPVQRSHLDSLFAICNNCAHPKEQIARADVERLLREGKLLTSVLT